ncbi:MAG: hypothetical protein KGQ51_02535 [Planctomycetes bacterium]|nr:hypothetical protein [Planctomycetota bacterium]
MPVEITDPTTDAQPFARTEQLFALMEAKHSVLADLRTLAMTQSEAIDKQDISELLNLLARKQVLMDRLMTLQQRMVTFQGEDPELRIWSSQDRRKACQEIKRTCDQWIQEILVMEQRAAEEMTAQRDAVAGQLLQVSDSMRLSRAYGFEGTASDDGEGGFSLDG